MSVGVLPGSTVFQACEAAGIEIPRFCYHERLLVAGNCRMCLVEIGGSPKPQASCALPVSPGMKVYTDSPLVKKARELVLEFLLLNHPLDCPICDQGGECDRQDESMTFGTDRGRGVGRYGRGVEAKRAVEDRLWNPMVKAIMTRCIHCTRCIRFSSEIAGVADRGTSGRGIQTEVGPYVSKPRATELSGNLIDLCPVGALTAKSYGFKARPWELKSMDTVDPMDGLGSSIRVQSRDQRILRILPRTNDEINQAWLDDKSRFSVDGIQNHRRTEPMMQGGSMTVSPEYAQAARDLLLSQGNPVSFVVSTSRSLEYRSGVLAWSHALRQRGVVSTVEALELPSLVRSRSGQEGHQGGVDGDQRLSRRAFLSQADLVLLVGFNPRVESPLLHARLRESYLRDRVQVMNRGPAVDRSFPVMQLGAMGDRWSQRLEGTHPVSSQLARAQRPMILVGPHAFGHDHNGGEKGRALGSFDTRQSRSDRRVREGRVQKGWQVRHVIHPTSSSAAASRWGRPAFQGWTPGSVVVTRGREEADLVRYGVDLPPFVPEDSQGRKGRVYMGAYQDTREQLADLSRPMPTIYEREGHLINTEGRIQRLVPSMGSEQETSRRPWLSWFGSLGSHTNEDEWRWTSVSSLVALGWDRWGRSARLPGYVGLSSRMAVPGVHDYYVETHATSRRSERMALASVALTRYSNYL